MCRKSIGGGPVAVLTDSVILYQPPILGVGASVRLTGGHIDLGTLGEFGRGLAKGITLGIDCQAEKLGDYILCGSASYTKTVFLISYYVRPSHQYIRIRIRDDAGRNLITTAKLSLAAAKRLIIRVNPPHNFVRVSQSTIHAASDIHLEYSLAEGPSEFTDLRNPFVVSGFSYDSGHKGSFVGRTANVFLLSSCLSDEEVSELEDATVQELNATYGIRPSIPPSSERRQVFIQDLSRLRRWVSKPQINASEAREASTLLHMWLFDPHPLLTDLCDELGVQLSFPCQTTEAMEYIEKIIAMKPSFYQVGVHGARALHGHDWQPLGAFGEEIAFHVEGHSVSHESFVKLVRHKLGGAHFDIQDRNKWQWDLKAYSDKIRLSGAQAINYQMRSLLKAVYEAIKGCGIEHQLRLQA